MWKRGMTGTDVFCLPYWQLAMLQKEQQNREEDECNLGGHKSSSPSCWLYDPSPLLVKTDECSLIGDVV